MRIAGAAGWIDIQVFQPGRAAESDDVAEVARTLGRRHELTGVARVLRTGTSRLANRRAGFEDATIQWRGREYRRRTWLTAARGSWIAVDQTAPTDAFDAMRPALDRVLASFAWATP